MAVCGGMERCVYLGNVCIYLMFMLRLGMQLTSRREGVEHCTLCEAIPTNLYLNDYLYSCCCQLVNIPITSLVLA